MNRLLRRTGLVIALPLGALALAGGALAYTQQSGDSTPEPRVTPAQEAPSDPPKDDSGCPHRGDKHQDGSNAANAV